MRNERPFRAGLGGAPPARRWPYGVGSCWPTPRAPATGGRHLVGHLTADGDQDGPHDHRRAGRTGAGRHPGDHAAGRHPLVDPGLTTTWACRRRPSAGSGGLGLKPHLVDTFKLSSDPQVVDRVRDVVGLKVSWGWLRRRYLSRWWPMHGKTELLRCGHVTVRRYRYRGAQTPRRGWRPSDPTAQRQGLVESRMRGNSHVRFGGAGRGNGSPERATPRPGPTLLAVVAELLQAAAGALGPGCGAVVRIRAAGVRDCVLQPALNGRRSDTTS